MINISLDEIIIQIKKGNEEALKLLFSLYEKHFKIIEKKMMMKYPISGYSREDVEEIIRIYTYEAIKRYDENKAVFYPFWKLLIERKIRDIYEKEYKETIIEKKKISLDNESIGFFSFESNRSSSPIDNYVLKDQYSEMIETVVKECGKKVGKILVLWCNGYSYSEIAKIFNISNAKVNYEIMKAKKILKYYYINNKNCEVKCR